jgi:hypothetical protein
MSITDIDQVSRVYSVPLTAHTALTIFAEGKEGRSRQPSQSETRRTEEQFSAVPYPAVITQQSKSWLVKATENITTAPQCQQIVIERLESEKEQSFPPLVCMEPAQIPLEGTSSARVLSRFESGAHKLSRVTSQNGDTVTKAPNHCAYLMLASFSDESLTNAKAVKKYHRQANVTYRKE